MRTALIATFAAGAAAFAPGPVARRPRTTMMAAGRPSTLVLLRHGESTWNNLNKFTGWYDCPLSEKGVGEATAAGPLLKDAGLVFDVAHTSYLQRAIKTLWLALEGCGQMSVPQKKSWRLNERHYGALQGLDKQETVAKHGIDQVNVWRRSYDIPPPAIEDLSSEHFPGNDPKYSAVPPELLPKSESLALTAARFESYWADEVVPDLRAGKTVLIAAHGNTLRALVQRLDGISNEEICGLNIPTGVPLVYALDGDLNVVPDADGIAPLQGKYLGDIDAVRKRIGAVAAQTKG